MPDEAKDVTLESVAEEYNNKRLEKFKIEEIAFKLEKMQIENKRHEDKIESIKKGIEDIKAYKTVPESATVDMNNILTASDVHKWYMPEHTNVSS